MTLQIAEYLLAAAMAFVVIALIVNLVALTARKKPASSAKKATVAADDDEAVVEELAVVGAGAQDAAVGTDDGARPVLPPEKPDEAPAKPAPARKGTGITMFGTAFAVIALVLLTAYLGVRMAITGHGPFANQHEFAVSFCWGIMIAYVFALWRFKIRVLSVVILPVVACLLVYAMRLDSGVQPLVPALQNNLLLTLHVGFAIVSYGAACVSFAAAIIYLIYPRLKLKVSRERFDEVGYKAAVVTFPLMTMMLIFGALWAETAWGSYWSWDPKETAALVTWLMYAGYLHARVARGWRGTRSAWLLIIGFAAVMFAYFGNEFFGGLHSYG